MATVKCPSCSRQLEVEDAYRDWTVRCPHCEHEFVPNDVQEAEAQTDDRPRRRRSRRDDDYDDRDDEPYGVPSDGRERALQIVAVPATCLEICGWLSALLSLGVTVLCIVLAIEMANNPPANRNGDDEVLVFVGCCVGFFGVPYGAVIAIGARKMRNLSSRGWAMTGAITSLAGFWLFGLLGLIHAGIGAWALVSLDKDEVKEVFGLPRRRRRRRRRRDWDD